MIKRKDLLQAVSDETGIDLDQVEKMYISMVRVITEALSRGEEVALSPELGNFAPKQWDNPGLSENSPHTRKAACYKLRFREGKELQKQLIIVKDGNE